MTYLEYLLSFVSGYSEYQNHTLLIGHLYQLKWVPTNIDTIRYRKILELRSDFDGRFPEGPISILELLVGLSRRIEETYAYRSDLGDRTGVWFWNMIANMGLFCYTDDAYDVNAVIRVIDSFNDRKYCPNGEGSIARTSSQCLDFRKMDYWDQILTSICENM